MEEEIIKIRKIINELINGNGRRFSKLKNIVKKLLKERTQKEIDKISKKELVAVRDSLEILKKSSLNEIDRAFLDYYFNKEKPEKYFWKEFHGKVSEEQFKRFAGEIYESGLLSKKAKEGFMSFIGWTLTVGGYHDDYSFSSKNKDFYLEFFLEDDSEKTIKLLILGDKKHERLIERIIEIFR